MASTVFPSRVNHFSPSFLLSLKINPCPSYSSEFSISLIFLPFHNVPYSLLERYYLLYSTDSPVRLEKVSFDNIKISMGLKAHRNIPSGAAILSSSSSMSTDIIPPERRSISIIKSHRSQLGPLGPRLLLGPLRFANHDCNPNCQVVIFLTLSYCRIFSLSIVRSHQGVSCLRPVDTSRHPRA
jgi:hypothetical protein